MNNYNLSKIFVSFSGSVCLEGVATLTEKGSKHLHSLWESWNLFCRYRIPF